MLGAHPTSPQPMTAGAALAVFGQHYEGLVRFLRQRTGCSDAAHELAHETWLRLVVSRYWSEVRTFSILSFFV